MPEVFRGTWLLRLTSDDGGKTYKAGDGKAVCEVSESGIKFAKKVDFAAEKLVLKSVTKLENRRAATYTLTFEGGEVWTVSHYPESITALIQKDDKGELTETYRITVRKQ